MSVGKLKSVIYTPEGHDERIRSIEGTFSTDVLGATATSVTEGTWNRGRRCCHKIIKL